MVMVRRICAENGGKEEKHGHDGRIDIYIYSSICVHVCACVLYELM